MRIGFDAKRAFHNGTGLGHYSRTLIHSLAELYPDHYYYLFNPKTKSRFNIEGENIYEIHPNDLFGKWFPGAWRSNWIKKDLQRLRIQLYHGLSHEIPVGIRKSGIPSVVTIHDLIHERHPEQYNPLDVMIYRKKFRHACKQARHIIAISEQTKKDIIHFYKTDESKITVCYQSCNPLFAVKVSEEEKAIIRAKYQLPERFFLYVGSIIERKNLLNICKALSEVQNELQIPLVVIGEGKKYKEKVKSFIKEKNLSSQVIFLSEKDSVKNSPGFISAADFPAIYQQATAMIYPSFFEGFGIPVLEALWSRLPVITSNVSSLPEAAGPGGYYVSPDKPEEIASAMKKIVNDPSFTSFMVEKGWEYAHKFANDKTAAAVMNVYKSVW